MRIDMLLTRLSELTADPAATEAFGDTLSASSSRPGDVITLSGPLGAGKTSIARGLLAALGLGGRGAVAELRDRPALCAARECGCRCCTSISTGSSNPDEIEELGLDEARGDSVLLIEWPERAPGRWPDALALTLDDRTGRRSRLDSDRARGMGGRDGP